MLVKLQINISINIQDENYYATPVGRPECVYDPGYGGTTPKISPMVSYLRLAYKEPIGAGNNHTLVFFLTNLDGSCVTIQGNGLLRVSCSGSYIFNNPNI